MPRQELDDFTKAYRAKHGRKKPSSMRELAAPYWDKQEREAKARIRELEKAIGGPPTKGRK